MEIAISLIPPASVIGIGLALGNMTVSYNALMLLIVNVLGLDIIGSMVILVLRGTQYPGLVLEKAIRQTVDNILDQMPEFTPMENQLTLVGKTIDVALLSSNAARVHVTVRHFTTESIPFRLVMPLAQIVAKEIQNRTSCRSEVTIELIPAQTYSTL